MILRDKHGYTYNTDNKWRVVEVCREKGKDDLIVQWGVYKTKTAAAMALADFTEKYPPHIWESSIWTKRKIICFYRVERYRLEDRLDWASATPIEELLLIGRTLPIQVESKNQNP